MPPSLSKPKPKTKTPVPGFCSTHAKKGSMQTCSRMPTRQSRLSPSSARAPHIHKLNKFALSLECDCRLVCSTWGEGCTILRFRNPPPALRRALQRTIIATTDTSRKQTKKRRKGRFHKTLTLFALNCNARQVYPRLKFQPIEPQPSFPILLLYTYRDYSHTNYIPRRMRTKKGDKSWCPFTKQRPRAGGYRRGPRVRFTPHGSAIP